MLLPSMVAFVTSACAAALPKAKKRMPDPEEAAALVALVMALPLMSALEIVPVMFRMSTRC